MPTTVAMRFPWGRYHATPWDRSVNEVAVEWPPSPWRLLRALYSAWKLRCPDLSPEGVAIVLGALTDPPSYKLPATFELSHTRHYLPGTAHRPGVKTDTTKTFDPMIVMSRWSAVLVQWPVQLGPAERAYLNRLVTAIPYLGRAESIVEGDLLHDFATDGWLEPTVDGTNARTQRLLTPTAPLDLAALTMSPHQVRSRGLLQPPSTRWVEYPVSESRDPGRRRSAKVRTRPTAVRMALTGPALPSRHLTVACADLLRRTALSQYGRSRDGAGSATLSGKDATGMPNQGPHDHAHYLPLIDKAGRLTGMVVWAPRGLDEHEVLALSRSRQLRLASEHQVRGLSGRQLHLGFEAVGDVKEVAPELATTASTWVSETPYALTRHVKRDIEGSLAAEVRVELDRRGLPPPEEVEVLRGDWLSYRRHRLGEKLADARRPFGLRIAFAGPVSGPLALGALSHYGLGLFRPEKPTGA